MSYSDLLRIRPFRLLWFGQAISQIGDAFYFVIFMFMVQKVTGSIASVGYVGALETIPYLIFGSYSGVLADRVDRRKIMLLSDLGSAVVLTLFALLIEGGNKPPIWTMYAAPFILSSVRVFFMPAKGAAIPALVPAEKLQSAIAFSSITQSMMPLLGLGFSAGVMGALYAASPKWFFLSAVLLDAASFYVSAAFIAPLPAILPERSSIHDTHPFTDFKNGLRFILRRRDLVVLIACLTMFRLFVAPFFTVYIAANEAWFGGKPSPIAWFEFSFWAGMVVSSFWVGKVSSKRPTVAFSVSLAIVGIGVGIMGLGPRVAGWVLGSVSFPLTGEAYWIAFLVVVFFNIICGLAVPFADIPTGTYLQLSVEDGYRGRVNAVLQMVATGIMPIGTVCGGLMVQRIGVENGFLIMGFGMFLTCLAGLADPTYRRIRMPDTAPATGRV